jgi:hypothetical protein
MDAEDGICHNNAIAVVKLGVVALVALIPIASIVVGVKSVHCTIFPLLEGLLLGMLWVSFALMAFKRPNESP